MTQAVIIGKVDLNDKRGGARKRPASPRDGGVLPPFPTLEEMVERVGFRAWCAGYRLPLDSPPK